MVNSGKLEPSKEIKKKKTSYWEFEVNAVDDLINT